MEFLDLGPGSLAKIKVIGIGGGGGNAIENMIASNLQGVTFIVANTDIQALNKSSAENKVQLGEKSTRGLGAGANPQIGAIAAQENIEQMREAIGECDMVFVTAGMGGGTGTGAAPIIAQIAREMGALTVGVVTKPFYFEGKRRMDIAEAGLQEFRQHVDSLITIPNDRLITLAPKNASLLDMLKKADEVLQDAVRGISDLIMVPGLINLDFADVRAVMAEAGLAMMGAGVAKGESRAKEAAMKAITSPLLEDVSIDGAKGILVNVTATNEVTMSEVTEAMDIIEKAASDDAHVFFGIVFDNNAGEELSITVIATGIEAKGVQIAPVSPGVSQFQRQSGSIIPPTGDNTPRSRGSEWGNNPSSSSALAEDSVGSPRPNRSFDSGNQMIPSGLRTGKEMPRTPSPSDQAFDCEDEFEIPSFIRKQHD